jgi:hypothetical protein
MDRAGGWGKTRAHMAQYLLNKTTYTVTLLEGAIASGRAEETILFSQKIFTL